MATAAFACLLLVSAEPSAGWVSSVVAREPGSMIRETKFKFKQNLNLNLNL